MNELRIEGYEVLRTAGSHGFADLIAVSREKRHIRFIQVKPDNMSETQKNKILAAYQWILGEKQVLWEVI